VKEDGSGDRWSKLLSEKISFEFIGRIGLWEGSFCRWDRFVEDIVLPKSSFCRAHRFAERIVLPNASFYRTDRFVEVIGCYTDSYALFWKHFIKVSNHRLYFFGLSCVV
jgi:hypothetical protein